MTEQRDPQPPRDLDDDDVLRWHRRAPRLVALKDDDLRFVALALRTRDRLGAVLVERLALAEGSFSDLLDRASDGVVDELLAALPESLFALADDVGSADASVDDIVVPGDLRRLTALVEMAGLSSVLASTILWPKRPDEHVIGRAWWMKAELLSALRHADERDWENLRDGVRRELLRRRRRSRRPLPAGPGSLVGREHLSPARQRALAAALTALPTVEHWRLDDVVTDEPSLTHDSKSTLRYREGTRQLNIIVGDLAAGEGLRFDPPHPSTGLLRRALERLIDVLFDVVDLPGVDALLQDRPSKVADALVAFSERFADRFAVGGSDEEGAVDVERVVWEVSALDGRHRLSVSCRAQRRQKNGKFGAGSVVSFDAVVRGEHGADIDDRRAAELARGQGHAANAALSLALGRALIGHPRVVDRQRNPLAVVAEDAHLVVDEADDGGLRLRLCAGDDVVSAAALSAGHGRVVRLGDRVVVVEVDTGLLEVARLLAVGGRGSESDVVTVPARERPRLVPALLALDGRIPIVFARSIVGERVAGDGRLVVRLRPTDPGLRLEIGVRPAPKGEWFRAGRGPDVVVGSKDGRPCALARDLGHEANAHAELVKGLPLDNAEFDTDGSAEVASDEEALAVLAALKDVVAADANVVVEWPDNLAVVARVAPSSVRLRLQRGADWLRVDADIDLKSGVDEDALALAELLQAVRAGRRFVRLSPGRFAAIEDSLRRRLLAVAALAGGVGDDDNAADGAGGVRVPWTAAKAVADLEGDLVFDDGRTVAELHARQAEARAVDDVPPPALLATLRPYQQAGLLWLRRMAAWGCGGVLADDMGLGKTLQALAILVERAPLGPALVIAPTSVALQWIDEAKKFAPTLRCVFATDKSDVRDADKGCVVVVTWTRLALWSEAINDKAFATAVFDEAHAVKNLDTRRAHAARQVNASFKLALTGTPVENHTGELWSLLRVTSPGLLGSSASFRERFQVPIERDGDVVRRELLSAAVRPFILRRTKAEVAPELPPRTEIVVRVPLPDDERTAYEAVRRVLADEWLSSERNQMTILSMITRLRLRACWAGFDDDAWLGGAAKLDAGVQLIASLIDAGHQVLVFSSFTRVLSAVDARLRERMPAARTTRLDGTTSPTDRAQRVASFQAGEHDVFFISLKAGGVGLNLTAATYVVLFDPWWNAAAEAQAADRAHRIGQTQPVTVYRLIAEGTIEEQVHELQLHKSQLADAVLAGTGAASTVDIAKLEALLQGAAASLGSAQTKAPTKAPTKRAQKAAKKPSAP